MSVIVICSGGLDSVNLAWKVANEDSLELLLSFDYGQRHRKELDFAKKCARPLGVPHRVIDLIDVGRALSGSALTDDIDVSDGHYAQENMKITIVPNHNAIMLAIAFGVAGACGADTVAATVHGGDHFIYPDRRPDFIESFSKMQEFALDGVADSSINTPFVNWGKSDIVTGGNRFSVRFEYTRSCYKGGETHYERCGTRVERREAFGLAELEEPTIYEGRNYWRSATKVN